MVSQNMLLNKILQTKDLSVVSLNGLDEKYFFNYSAEFKYIKNHYDQYKVVPDKLTFANVFQNFEFVDVSEPDSFLLEQLYKDYNTQHLVTCFNTVRKLLQAGEVEKAQTVFENAYDGLHTGNVLTCTNLLEDTSRYTHYIERTTDHKKYYLSTGFQEYDKLVGGIDRFNENMVIVARPSVGKTQVLLKMAAAASLQGLRVGIYEGEMTADKIGYRLDTFIGHISNTDLNRGGLYVQKEYETYIKSLSASGYGSIKVLTQNDVPSGIVTVDTLKTFIEKENIEILFIDQYDLLEDNSNARVEHERIGNIAKSIKRLQVEKQIPIISVCQMNRTKNDDGSQDTTQVSGSDKISRYATVIIALDQKYHENTRQTTLTLNVIKARDGVSGNASSKLVYDVDFNRGYFNYIPSEKDDVTTEQDLNDISASYELDISEDSNVF